MLKLSRKWLYGVLTALLLSGLIPGCELFDNSMVDYLLDNTGPVKAETVEGKSPVVFMTNGTILIPPVDDDNSLTILELSLSNPRNLMVLQELGGVPEGKSISVRQIEAERIEITIDGAAELEEYTLTLAMQSPDGLRDFPAYPLVIKCVSFDTGLQDFSINDVTPPAFNPTKGSFQTDVPYYGYEAPVLSAASVHEKATLALYKGTAASGTALEQGVHKVSHPAPLIVGNNYFYLTITAPNFDSRGYAFAIYRGANPDRAITDFYFSLGGKLYGVGGDPSLEAGSGTIDEENHAVTITVPYRQDLSALPARVIHTGASISPDPAVAANYTGPVTYTVTADNGGAQEYTVTAAAAKIASLDIISFADGFKQTGSDISGDIKAAITSVTGTDGLGAAIVLSPEDYSVDALVPATNGAGTTATLRVPAGRSSTGADIVQDFTVYIKSGAEEITDFYFTIGAKKYGAGAEAESGSASISENSIAITVPYGTDTTSLPAPTVRLGRVEAAISPDPAGISNYGSPVTYTVTAEDGTTRTYTVTVIIAQGITISGITYEGLAKLSFNGVPSKTVTGTLITITINGGTVADWHIDLNGPEKPTKSGNGSIQFNAPGTKGYYSVNVFATVGGVLYSGSFGMRVE